MSSRVIFTSGINDDKRDSWTAQVVKQREGMALILFDDAESYWVWPEEIEVIP